MVLDEGEAARPQDVIVAALHGPVEVRQSELVVADRAVADAVGGPGRQVPLLQVAGEHLRGGGARARPGNGGGKQGDLQEGAVQPPQELSHGFYAQRVNALTTVVCRVGVTKWRTADKLDRGILETLLEEHNLQQG